MFPFISQVQLEKTLARAEEVLNLVGYIPLVSILSATVRSIGGILQALLGISCAFWYFFAGHIFKKANTLQKWRLSTHYLFHGLFNIIRAKIEAVPFLSLITCLPYDRLLKKRFKYPAENQPEEDEMEVDIS